LCLGVSFPLRKQENDVDVLDWLSQSPDAHPIENVCTYEVQALRKEDLDHQAVISTDSTYMKVSRLCYKISRKCLGDARQLLIIEATE